VSDVTLELVSNPVSINFGNFDTVSGASALTVANRIVKVAGSGGITMATIAESAITGVLTLTKTGTTARTVTFPDAAIGVQSETEEQTGNFTARVHGQYVATATLTVTDPTPSQGHEFVVHVRNGTATVGGTAYAAGQTIWRSYHSGAWSNTVLASLGTAQTWPTLQTFSNGLTVSSGTTALQAATCTTLGATGKIASSKASAAANITDANCSLKLYDSSLGAGLFGQQTSGAPYDFQIQVADATMASTFPLSLNPLGGAVKIGSGGLTVSAGVTCTTLTGSGILNVTHATTGDNAAYIRNTHAAGYGPVIRGGGGGAGLYTSIWQQYDGTKVMELLNDGTLQVVNGITCTTLTASGLTSITTSTAMTTPASNAVHITNGAIRCGNTSATSIETAGGVTALGRNSVFGTAAAPITMGNQASDYPDIGYNITRDASGSPTYSQTDTASSILFTAGALSFRGAPSGTGGTDITWEELAKFDRSTTATHTRFMIYDVDNGTLERVTVGAADSGGAGFKVLRIPN
jgi:hypothetical protein